MASIFTTYSMILSPTFPPRAWFGVLTFATVAFMTLLYDIYDFNKLFRHIFYNLILISFLYFIPNYLSTFNDINNLENTWGKRINEIQSEKNKEEKSFEFDNYYTANPHNPIYGLVDLNSNSKAWPNPDIAKYYGIKSIQSLKK